MPVRHTDVATTGNRRSPVRPISIWFRRFLAKKGDVVPDRRKVALLGASTVLLVVSVAFAADVAVRGRRLAVREGPSGEPSRKVVIVGREASADQPVPEFSSGANLRVELDGASPQSQLYFLPANGWTSTARGQRFQGTGSNPVQEVLIETDGTEPVRVRVVLRGDVGTTPLNLVPPDPGSGGSMTLAGVGDTYCVVLGGAAGGTITANTERAFRMRGATSEVACPPVPTVVPPTPSPGPTSGGCIEVCAPTPTPTATPVPCPSPCPFTPSPPVTPFPVPSSSPPFPTPTPTPCPTICS